MEQGWIYVVVNSSMPAMTKVGRTTREPQRRVAELSSATGVATPFVLAFEQEFEDCVRAERDIHAMLDARGLRVAQNREFFHGSPGNIVRVVLDYAGLQDVGTAIGSEPPAMSFLAEGDFLMAGAPGMAGAVEAMRCYRLAARAGVLQAHERLARLYLRVEGRVRGARRALQQLKEGARQGNYYCYAEMAELFASAGQAADCSKAWDLFFAARANCWRGDVETAPDHLDGSQGARYPFICRRYIATCLAMGHQPGHLQALRQEAEAILAQQLADLERLQGSIEARHRLATAMRWTYLNLVMQAAPVAQPAAARGWRQLGELAPGGSAPA